MLVHADKMLQDKVKTLALCTWAGLRRAMSEHLVGCRFQLDSDYSPSEPAPKITRFVTMGCIVVLKVIMSVISWIVQGFGGFNFMCYGVRLQ